MSFVSLTRFNVVIHNNEEYIYYFSSHQDCQEDIIVHLLLAVDRRVSVSEAEDVVTMAAELQEESGGIVLGVDLSGDPNVSSCVKLYNTMRIQNHLISPGCPRPSVALQCRHKA